MPTCVRSGFRWGPTIAIRAALAMWMLTVASGCTERVLLIGTWYDFAWSARVPIRIDYSDRSAPLSDFPVLLALTPAEIDYSRSAPNGHDLLAVERATGRVLPHEIEQWQPEGTSYIWVLAPTIDADGVERVIDLYYDNPTATDDSGSGEVFTDEYAAVFHLTRDLRDSSRAHNDGTDGGSVPAAGRIAGAQHFSVANVDRIAIGRDGFPSGREPRTLCAWASADQLDIEKNYAIVAYGDGSRDSEFYLDRYGPLLKCGQRGATELVSSTELRTDAWFFACCTFDGDEAALYLDGVEVAREAAAWDLAPPTEAWIGGHVVLTTDSWDGAIDEVRISRVARTPAWIATEMRNIEGSLVVFGPPEFP